MPQATSTFGQRLAGTTTGSCTEAPIVLASTSTCQVVTWWSPNAGTSRTSCGGVFGSGLSVMRCA